MHVFPTHSSPALQTIGQSTWPAHPSGLDPHSLGAHWIGVHPELDEDASDDVDELLDPELVTPAAVEAPCVAVDAACDEAVAEEAPPLPPDPEEPVESHATRSTAARAIERIAPSYDRRNGTPP
jgi:hypothetical protein